MAAKRIVGSSETTVDYIGPKPGEGPMLYANNVEVGSSVFDVSIRFNRIIAAEAAPGGTAGKLTVAHQGIVSMSPQHAKSLLDILQRQIDDYERTYGSIDLPETPTEGE